MRPLRAEFDLSWEYPHTIACAIDRVCVLNQEIAAIADVSKAVMVEKFQVFCRLCGYYRLIRKNNQTLLSSVWLAALDRRRVRQMSSETKKSARPLADQRGEECPARSSAA